MNKKVTPQFIFFVVINKITRRPLGWLVLTAELTSNNSKTLTIQRIGGKQRNGPEFQIAECIMGVKLRVHAATLLMKKG